MPTLDAALQAHTAAATLARSSKAPTAYLARLAVAVVLALVVIGGVVTLAFGLLLDAGEPPRLAPATTSAPLPATNGQAIDPAAHMVVDDRAEPPIEPPPAS